MNIKNLEIIPTAKLSERANKEVQKFIKDMEDGIARGEIVLKSGVAKDLEKLKMMMKESDAAHERIVELGKVGKSQRAKVVFYYRELFAVIAKVLLAQLGIRVATMGVFISMDGLMGLSDQKIVFALIGFLSLIIQIMVGMKIFDKYFARLSSTQYDAAVKEQAKKVKALIKKAHSINKKVLS